VRYLVVMLAAIFANTANAIEIGEYTQRIAGNLGGSLSISETAGRFINIRAATDRGVKPVFQLSIENGKVLLNFDDVELGLTKSLTVSVIIDGQIERQRTFNVRGIPERESFDDATEIVVNSNNVADKVEPQLEDVREIEIHTKDARSDQAAPVAKEIQCGLSLTLSKGIRLSDNVRYYIEDCNLQFSWNVSNPKTGSTIDFMMEENATLSFKDGLDDLIYSMSNWYNIKLTVLNGRAVFTKNK
jgi:hypothetical protein